MGDDTKIKELLSRVIIKPAFIKGVSAIRFEFGIPEDGFETYEQNIEWLNHFRTAGKTFVSNDDSLLKREATFLSKVSVLLHSLNLPTTLLSATANYVFNNNRFNVDIKKHSFGCAIESPRFTGNELSVERYWDSKKIRYTRLLIHEQASKADVINFIKANWVEIQRSISPISTKKPRVRKRTKADEHESVYSIYNELKSGVRKVESRYKYIELQIANILKNEQGLTLDSDNIRKIISLEKQRRK